MSCFVIIKSQVGRLSAVMLVMLLTPAKNAKNKGGDGTMRIMYLPLEFQIPAIIYLRPIVFFLLRGSDTADERLKAFSRFQLFCRESATRLISFQFVTR